MRTVLATLALALSLPAMAHGGHADTPMHSHGADLFWLLATAAAVGVWLWRRGGR